MVFVCDAELSHDASMMPANLQAGAACLITDAWCTCRVLFGRMHVLSYDWADRQQHTACLALDSEVEAGDTTVLGPDFGGNMHCLTAITDVAIFDVLAPSYDPKGGTGFG